MLSYSHAMDNVILPPELERFATEAVAAGRYRDVSNVVAAGVSLLQRQEQARAELLASVLAAREESDQNGYLNGDEVAERVRAPWAADLRPAAAFVSAGLEPINLTGDYIWVALKDASENLDGLRPLRSPHAAFSNAA